MCVLKKKITNLCDKNMVKVILKTIASFNASYVCLFAYELIRRIYTAVFHGRFFYFFIMKKHISNII